MYFYPGPVLSDLKLQSPRKCLCDAVACWGRAALTGESQGICKNDVRERERNGKLFVFKDLLLKKNLPQNSF